MSIAWETLQTAVKTWVLAGSGYASGRVFWSHQNGGKPINVDSITMRMVGPLRALGACDEVQTLTDLGRPAGQEIEHRVIGRRELTLSLQAFTTTTVGSSRAVSTLSKVQAALSLPSVREALRAAGLFPFDAGAVVDLTALRDADFEGRAELSVRFYCSEEVSEFLGYIATVELEDYTGNATIDI